ncbi:hypothetical protein B7494_g7929 [Chlorociboria aeruginascens]|nr:hypothetical protein B7494_g7929 [Chlorociboria aeruginascens]
MVISDIHGHSFDGTTTPKVDVFLHARDLTNECGLDLLKEGILILGTIEQRKPGLLISKKVPTFTLNNGDKFTVHASPYTPGSGSWAFAYQRLGDQLNDASSVGPNRTSIASNPIPSNIDSMMTHGPPESILDQVDGDTAYLLLAIGRVKPCQGHIHEGHSCASLVMRVIPMQARGL